MFVNLKTTNVKDWYDIGKMIGEGAFGQVFVAMHKQTSYYKNQFLITMFFLRN